MLLILSYNVAGWQSTLRQIEEQYGDLRAWLTRHGVDVLALQEAKVPAQRLRDSPKRAGAQVEGYDTFWACCQGSAGPKGVAAGAYSGVATFARVGTVAAADPAPLGCPELDREGRCLLTDHGLFVLLNVYAPASGEAQERLPYKLRFLRRLGEKVTSRTSAQQLPQAFPCLVTLSPSAWRVSLGLHALLMIPNIAGGCGLLCPRRLGSLADPFPTTSPATPKGREKEKAPPPLPTAAPMLCSSPAPSAPSFSSEPRQASAPPVPPIRRSLPASLLSRGALKGAALIHGPAYPSPPAPPQSRDNNPFGHPQVADLRRSGRRVIVAGDLNVARRPQDVFWRDRVVELHSLWRHPGLPGSLALKLRDARPRVEQVIATLRVEPVPGKNSRRQPAGAGQPRQSGSWRAAVSSSSEDGGVVQVGKRFGSEAEARMRTGMRRVDVGEGEDAVEAWGEGWVSVSHLEDVLRAAGCPLAESEAMQLSDVLGGSYSAPATRAWFDELLEQGGMVDTFAALRGRARERFTAWDQYTNARQ